ncbi:DUF2752 domain-containing protein [Streptomyces sp. NRRL S-378]|uniref:DUF2752 domain-containing protein n=1 Tax=Streptomyces sp. NRRL S-378 TaxID=1463904 RepID=UPI0018FEE0C4|nr:DUF2752 domain-containing protein [Streptomyces sp. NRRL S-378]
MNRPNARAFHPVLWASRPQPVRDAWLAAALFAWVAVAVRLADPTRPGRFPRCPFHALTGLDCPGCGSLRALHQLTRADVVAAADYNLLLVLALPAIGLAWLRVVTGRTTRRVRPAWRGPRVILAGVALWTVVRNLPVLGGVLGA